jgi:D-glycero-D-manno-heptose 1,7-bisphosphate phosphatase
MHAGIFYDRDGTINEERNYLSSPDQLHLFPKAAQALIEAQALGYKNIIISNQSGVARGYITEEQVRIVHEALLHLLKNEGATVDAIYYCPHHPETGNPPYRKECECRKPKIGMLLQAARELSLDLRQSFVIGDKLTDIQTAINAGAQGILVKTGYGSQEMNLLQSNNVTTTYIAENVYDAIQFIKKSQSSTPR